MKQFVRRHRWMFLTGLGGVLLALVVYGWVFGLKPWAARRHYNQIAFGMERKDVESLLGVPMQGWIYTRPTDWDRIEESGEGLHTTRPDDLSTYDALTYGDNYSARIEVLYRGNKVMMKALMIHKSFWPTILRAWFSRVP